MTNQESHLNVQAVRRVYENDLPTSNSATTSAPLETIYLVCHPDASSGRDILLWDDILAAFKEDIIHVRYKAVVLPFLKGPNFKNLEPLRIAKIPGATLDIVVKGQLRERVHFVEPPKKGLFTWQENSNACLVSASMTTPATIGRNPTFSPIDGATGNSAYNHNQTSAYTQDERESQVDPYHISAFNNSNNGKHGKNNNANSEISNCRNNNTSAHVLQVQEQSSSAIEDLAETMEKTSLGYQRELRTRLVESNVLPVSESMTNLATVRRNQQTIAADKAAETPTYSYNHILNSTYLPDEQESQYIPYHIRAFNHSDAGNTVKPFLSLPDQFAVTQSRIQALLTQTYELHENPIPRLFIILPKDTSEWNPVSLLNNQFQLYFLCECSEYTNVLNGDNNNIPHHIHIAEHEGYDLQRPTEFFQKYGRYMLTLLEMIKHGSTIAGYAVPALSSAVVSGAIDTLANSQDTVTPSVINQSIKYLQTFLSEQDAAKDTSMDSIVGQETLDGDDLRHLEMFIKSKDQDRALGNLYRTITDEGHVKWVCIDHYRFAYEERDQQTFVTAVELNCGHYNPYLGGVTVSWGSEIQAARFLKALAKARCVDELDVTFNWEVTTSDLEALGDALESTAVSILRLDIQRYRTSHASKLEITNTQQALARCINLPSMKMIHIVLPVHLFELFSLQPKRLSFPPKLSFEVVSRFKLAMKELERLAERRGIRTRRAGTVVFFNALKGFGFITPKDGGENLFLHQSVIEGNYRELEEGQVVYFNDKSGDDGRLKASLVRMRDIC